MKFITSINESKISLYKRLASKNSELMRGFVNTNRPFSDDLEYQELTVQSALKDEDTNSLKFWLDASDNIVLVTVGNFAASSDFKPIRKLGSRDLEYFYKHQIYSSQETFDWIKVNGIKKLKTYLKGAAAKAIVIDIQSYTTGNATAKIKAETHNGYPIVDITDSSQFFDKVECFYRVTMEDFPKFDSRNIIPTGSQTDAKEADVVKFFKSILRIVPVKRGNAEAGSTGVQKIDQSGAISYKVKIDFDSAAGISPSPALISSFLKKFNLVPSDSFYSKYFISLTLSKAASPKAAKMLTTIAHTAFFNSHVNDALEKALKLAPSYIRAHRSNVGSSLMRMWNEADFNDQGYIDFFNNVTMFYTGADKLKGEPANMFSKVEKTLLLF